MTGPRTYAALLLLPLLLGVSPAEPAPAPGPLGFVVAHRGQVAIRTDGADWSPVQVDTPIHAGDRLRTGPDSGLKLFLGDDVVAVLDAGTTLGVGEGRVLRLRAGRVRLSVAGGGFAALRTATAATELRGGVHDVLFAAGPPMLTFACSRASGLQVRSVDPAIDGQLAPAPGACVRVPRGKPPEQIGWRPERLASPPAPLASPVPEAGAGVAAGPPRGLDVRDDALRVPRRRAPSTTDDGESFDAPDTADQ